MTVILGAGDGSFTSSPPLIHDQQPVYVATGDFNADGRSDFAITTGENNTVPIYLAASSPVASTATATVSNISPVGTGPHLVDASYPGDSTYAASLSNTVSLTAQRVPTTLTLTAAAAPTGGPITLTAALSPDLAQNHAATGLVTFSSNGSTIGSGDIANVSPRSPSPRCLRASTASQPNIPATPTSPLAQAQAPSRSSRPRPPTSPSPAQPPSPSPPRPLEPEPSSLTSLKRLRRSRHPRLQPAAGPRTTSVFSRRPPPPRGQRHRRQYPHAAADAEVQRNAAAPILRAEDPYPSGPALSPGAARLRPPPCAGTSSRCSRSPS